MRWNFSEGGIETMRKFKNKIAALCGQKPTRTIAFFMCQMYGVS